MATTLITASSAATVPAIVADTAATMTTINYTTIGVSVSMTTATTTTTISVNPTTTNNVPTDKYICSRPLDLTSFTFTLLCWYLCMLG